MCTKQYWNLFTLLLFLPLCTSRSESPNRFGRIYQKDYEMVYAMNANDIQYLCIKSPVAFSAFDVRISSEKIWAFLFHWRESFQSFNAKLHCKSTSNTKKKSAPNFACLMYIASVKRSIQGRKRRLSFRNYFTDFSKCLEACACTWNGTCWRPSIRWCWFPKCWCFVC